MLIEKTSEVKGATMKGAHTEVSRVRIPMPFIVVI
jgi:hypothetical protein